jgi:hypothetical protein
MLRLGFGLGFGRPFGGAVDPLANLNLFADSVAGDDGNDGLTYATAVQTIAQAQSQVADPTELALIAGSYWREEFRSSDAVNRIIGLSEETLPTLGAALPILDGADIIAPGDFTPSTHPNAPAGTYEVTLSRDPNGTYVSGDTYMMWEDGEWLVRRRVASGAVGSAAEIIATLTAFVPGSYYVPQMNALASPSLAYVFPFGSTDPRSDGKTYEYSKRATGIEAYAYHGQIIQGVHVTRGMSAYGPLTGGRDSIIRRVLSSKGGKHNIVLRSGLIQDTICFDAEVARAVLSDGGLIPITFYQADASGLNWAINNSMVIFPTGRQGTGQAVYSHGSSGSPGHHTKGTINGLISLRGGEVTGVLLDVEFNDYCALQNTTRSLNIPNAASTIKVRRFLADQVAVQGVTIVAHPSAGGTTGANLEASDWALVKRADGAVTTGSMVDFAIASVVNFHHNALLMSGGSSMVSMQAAQAGSQCKYNIFILNKAGVVPYLQITPNVDSDYNVFIDIVGMTDYWQSTTTGTAFSISEWRSESGKDINSVVLNAAQCEDLFLNGLAGMANGDFRLDPACTLTFVDGTPIVGNAGPQTYYDWNDKTVKAGQPFSWPTPPATEAECVQYLRDIPAWDFYP